jgi:hypothetical protein
MESGVQLRTKDNYRLTNEIRDYRLRKMQNKKEIEDGLRPPFVYLYLVQLEKLRYHQIYLLLLQQYSSTTLSRLSIIF